MEATESPGPKGPIVYIVDDEEDVRELLCDLFHSVGLKATGFVSAQAFLDTYQPGLRGCLLLDVRMPGMSGLELKELLADLNFDLPIIFLTGHGDVEMAVDALKAGVFDFIEKPFNTEKLIDRVQRAIHKNLDAEQANLDGQEAQGRLRKLTARERQILEMLVVGEINKVIAAHLDISSKTVEYHRANIMKKMQVSTLAALIRISRLETGG
ncbi:MAG: response regulator transcription factor [Rhodospirillaceae bacterium]|nr:response regulator transcription factor [Rhodospirillaceae bacterium]